MNLASAFGTMAVEKLTQLYSYVEGKFVGVNSQKLSHPS